MKTCRITRIAPLTGEPCSELVNLRSISLDQDDNGEDFFSLRGVNSNGESFSLSTKKLISMDFGLFVMPEESEKALLKDMVKKAIAQCGFEMIGGQINRAEALLRKKAYTELYLKITGEKYEDDKEHV